MHIRSAFLLSFIFLAGNCLNALELVLKNGDKLNGKLVKQTDSHVVIAHPQLGEIEIAKSALESLPAALMASASNPDVPPDVNQEADPASPSEIKTPTANQPSLPAEEGRNKIGNGLGDLHKLVLFLPQELIRTLVDMNSSIGFSYNVKESRKDRNDLRFYFNSKWKNGKSDFLLDTDYQFGKINDELSDDSFLADFRYRRYQQKDYFLQIKTRYKTDDIREINHFLEQGIGLGWNRRLSPQFEYYIGPQLVALFRDLDVSNQELGGWSYFGSVFQDSEFKINEFYQLAQEAQVYLAPEDTDDWGYAFEVKLTGKISKGLSLRLGYEFSYDNQVPRKVPKEESSFYSSLMYTF